MRNLENAEQGGGDAGREDRTARMVERQG